MANILLNVSRRNCSPRSNELWRCFTRQFNKPPTANDLARPCGIASMQRLPVQSTSEGLDACFIGVPFDMGAGNRVGTRFGPRQIRTESVLLRRTNSGTGAAPYDSLQVADVGDVHIKLFNIKKACDGIRDHYREIIKNGCKPLTMGGDHTITYPILQAIKEKYGPVGLIHIDAHEDTQDVMIGEKIAHGTPFFRCVEEGLIESKRVVQIGLRGSCFGPEAREWGVKQGFRCVSAEECWHKSLVPLMEEVRAQMGSGPVYISFDIDGIDPGFAPGTGTPEIAGLTPIQAVEIIRGCRGLNVIGTDLVEVSPPYDTTGTTALLGANLLFEMLCVLPGVKYV
ncbi:PREDICTED: agmatinase, mitochondrial-like [Priapulus caudatus]|uniref:Agmatinase, mitochondrial-like n=1 Tax=Priapulus caudatus TaxID=37621 RepID=A0ABM1EXM7_PRICU|nr:PREDICTED: agmatinase, mitochondrial-like [Priapulus caudatus]